MLSDPLKPSSGAKTGSETSFDSFPHKEDDSIVKWSAWPPLSASRGSPSPSSSRNIAESNVTEKDAPDALELPEPLQTAEIASHQVLRTSLRRWRLDSTLHVTGSNNLAKFEHWQLVNSPTAEVRTTRFLIENSLFWRCCPEDDILSDRPRTRSLFRKLSLSVRAFPVNDVHVGRLVMPGQGEKHITVVNWWGLCEGRFFVSALVAASVLPCTARHSKQKTVGARRRAVSITSAALQSWQRSGFFKAQIITHY
jgi:hypothetical protein